MPTCGRATTSRCGRSRARSSEPASSSPNGATRRTPAPSVARSAVSPAPPGLRRTPSVSTTGTGPSGEKRVTWPSTSRSRSTSPTTTTCGPVAAAEAGGGAGAGRSSADPAPGRSAAACASRWRTCASSAAHSACTTTRCSSWTDEVDAPRRASTSSHAAASAQSRGPVSAHVVRPSSRARWAAATTFSLSPEVDRSTSTSPGRPCAATWRAYISAMP
ncbi:Uncharacterised protein [Mycobacteroides abscessus]|nr:Uncharacterised protein [Mycobacteroides abscessus]